jgi:hypothetical protein
MDFYSLWFPSQEKKWVCVDLETGKVNAAAELEGALGRGVSYVLAIDTRDAVKDVTRRYAASHFMTQTREGLFMVNS